MLLEPGAQCGVSTAQRTGPIAAVCLVIERLAERGFVDLIYWKQVDNVLPRMLQAVAPRYVPLLFEHLLQVLAFGVQGVWCEQKGT